MQFSVLLLLTVLYSVRPCLCSSIANKTRAILQYLCRSVQYEDVMVGEVAYPGLAPSGEITSRRRPNQNFRACPAARAPPSAPQLLADKTPWGALTTSPNADWLWQNAVRVHKRPYTVLWPPPIFFFSLFLFYLFSLSLSSSSHPLILFTPLLLSLLVFQSCTARNKTRLLFSCILQQPQAASSTPSTPVYQVCLQDYILQSWRISKFREVASVLPILTCKP